MLAKSQGLGPGPKVHGPFPRAAWDSYNMAQGFKSGCSKIQDSPSLLRLESTSWHIITGSVSTEPTNIHRTNMGPIFMGRVSTDLWPSLIFYRMSRLRVDQLWLLS